MFKKLMSSLFIAAVLYVGAFSNTAQASLINTDLELQLLADVSGSVDSNEYLLQLMGYANAFRSASVINAITNGSIGSIAVQYVEWASSNQQAVQVDWMLIDSAVTAYAFADALEAVSRAFSGLTGIGSALEFGSTLFASNNFNGSRQVVDISGDGQNNTGVTIQTGKDAMFAAGVDVINGITVGNEFGLGDYYKNNVIGGKDSFHIHAATFADFAAGIEQKLVREISTPTVSAPATAFLFAFGFAGLMLRRRNV